MNDLFWPLRHQYVLVFFDDISAYSKSWSDHIRHLEHVLALLALIHFFAKLWKCAFGVSQVDFLRHVISAKGVQADPDKIQAMFEWPQPKSVFEVRGFLGLTGYYRRFVKDNAQIARSLTDLLKTNGFLWLEAAFSSL